MVKNSKRYLDPYKLILIGLVLIYFVPLFLFPEIIINKDNDLGRTLTFLTLILITIYYFRFQKKLI